VRAVVDEVAGAHGRIDVLHNNVGYATMGGPIELDEEAWQRTIDLNVKSCFLTCKHVLPHMLARRSGAIVNVSSIAAVRYTGYPYVAYYAAKAAVNNFTMGLALQYARDGIRVNAIMPGLMNTPLIFQQISGQYADAEEMVRARDAACPTGRWERPGTSRTRPCSSRPMTPAISRASACRSTGACRAGPPDGHANGEEAKRMTRIALLGAGGKDGCAASPPTSGARASRSTTSRSRRRGRRRLKAAVGADCVDQDRALAGADVVSWPCRTG
jgi:hypothetical protein